MNYWCVSLDDLRVFSDIFKDDPFQFLHYLKERKMYISQNFFLSDDELDLLQMYLINGKVGIKQPSIPISDVFVGGFRDKIDKYYQDLLEGKTPVSPKRPLPKNVELEIKDVLEDGKGYKSSRIFSILEDHHSESN